MKRRFFTSLLAVVLAVAMAFTMVGCQEESNAISQKEFMNGVKSSYDNYVSAYKDYDVFGDITVTFSSEDSSEGIEQDYSYTPDGGTAVTGTYQDTFAHKREGSISIKNVGDDLFLTSQHVTTVKRVVHTVTETELIKDTTVTVTTEKYEFGVENGTYFARLTAEESDDGSGTAVTTKTYQTFDDKSAYVMVMNELLADFNEYYGELPFESFSSSGTFLLMPVEYAKENGTYILSIGISLVEIDTDENSSDLIDQSAIVKFGDKGAVSMDSVQDYGGNAMKTTVEFKYSSSLKAIANFSDGFESGTIDCSGVIENSPS